MKNRVAYCVSDHTGVTVEAVAKSVLSQFPALEFSLIVLPFVDSAAKAEQVAARIAASPGALVFSTLTDPALRGILRDAGSGLFDVFELVAPSVETALGQAATPRGGRIHGMANDYESRMDAVNFALNLDDGLNPERLGRPTSSWSASRASARRRPRSTSPCNTACAPPTIRSPRTTWRRTACPKSCSPTCPGCGP
jgi:hypothetical protein